MQIYQMHGYYHPNLAATTSRYSLFRHLRSKEDDADDDDEITRKRFAICNLPKMASC